MRAMLAAMMVLSLLASPSKADDTVHCPEPGTVITYNDGNSLTFTNQAGNTCRARNGKGALVSLFVGLSFPEVDQEKYHAERLLPLRSGSQIDFMTSGNTQNATGDLVNTTKDVYYDNTITVARQEKVTTAAGTFDTYVIEWHRQARGRWSGAWLSTVWFGPDLGSLIKSKFETRQGYGPDSSVEIASIIAPKGTNAPIARAVPTPSPQTMAGSPPPGNARALDTVKLDQANGQLLVAVEVNGKITLNFILDSGAADVAIPADVVQTLRGTGTVSNADFIGTKTYVLADGSKLPGEAFILHEVRVGDHVVKNITAGVSPVQGKLLLGQSFLSRLPAWTIDNKQHALIIIGDPADAGTPAAVERVAATPQPRAPAPPPPAPVPAAAPVPRPQPQPAPSPASFSSSTAAPSPPTVLATIPPPPAATTSGETGFRCPRPGTFVQYNNGTSLKFGGANGLRCAYVAQNFRDAEKFAAFADNAKFLDAGLDKLWPLLAGKQQAFSIYLGGAYLTQRFSVLRKESVATPAGAFEAVVVEQEETGTAIQWAKRLYWYVPESGLVVKSTFTVLKGADRLTGAGIATASLLPGDYEAVRIEGTDVRPPQ